MGLERIEEYVFTMGSWKSIEELEENVTIDELHRLFVTKQKIDHEARQFAAGLKGIKMDPFVDPDEKKTELDEVNKRADIKRRLILQGKNPNNYANIEEMEQAIGLREMQELGFGIEEE